MVFQDSLENIISSFPSSKMNAIKCNRLDDIKAATVEYKVIAIDEGQFVSYIFTIKASQNIQFPDIVEFCENLANSGKIVVVAALDGTYQRRVSGVIIGIYTMYF